MVWQSLVADLGFSTKNTPVGNSTALKVAEKAEEISDQVQGTQGNKGFPQHFTQSVGLTLGLHVIIGPSTGQSLLVSVSD